MITRYSHVGQAVNSNDNKNSHNIPMENIEKLHSLPKEKRIVLFCQKGDYSAEIAELLDDNGYTVVDLTGGYRDWITGQFA